MLRIRDNQERDGQGRILHEGAPFSGLLYTVSDAGLVVQIQRVEDGTPMGISDDWLDLPPGGERVASELLELSEGDGPLLRNGAPFTGIAYSFDDDGTCAAEDLHRNGDLVRARAWYPSGERRHELDGKGCTYWRQDGKVRAREWRSSTVYEWTLDDAGNLESLVLADQSWLDPGLLMQLPLAPSLALIGEGIDDDVLRLLRAHRDFNRVSSLRLLATDVSSAGLEVLDDLPYLHALELLKNPGLGTKQVDWWRAAHPGCRVEFQRGAPRSARKWLRIARERLGELRSPALAPERRNRLAAEVYRRALKAYFAGLFAPMDAPVAEVVWDLGYRTLSPMYLLAQRPHRIPEPRWSERVVWEQGIAAVRFARLDTQMMLRNLGHAEVWERLSTAGPTLPRDEDALTALCGRVKLAAISEHGTRLT